MSSLSITPIVNADNTLTATDMFILSKVERNKKQYLYLRFIDQSNGIAKKTWQLQSDGLTLTVLNKP